MAHWTVTTQDKKSVEEREIWTKDGKTITRINGFRWGTFVVTTEGDEPLKLNVKNPDGYDFYSLYDNDDNYLETELVSMDDGWHGDYEFSDNISEEEQEELIEGMEDDYYEYLEDNGWCNDDTEGWMFGPLKIEDEAGNVVAQGIDE